MPARLSRRNTDLRAANWLNGPRYVDTPLEAQKACNFVYPA